MINLYVYEVLPAEPVQIAKQREELEKGYQGLKGMFVFDDFRIVIRHCGIENAFSNPDITLCKELEDSFQRMKIPNAMGFVFYHELGHTFLKLWGYPAWDNEDVADEFATVLSIVGNSTNSALETAKWWANSTSKQEALSKIWVDDRHTISPQRARNIVRWLNNPSDLIHRWQKIFIPNMQTAFLQRMIDSGTTSVDRELVRGELVKRNALAAQQPTNGPAVAVAVAEDSVRTRIKEAMRAATATRNAIYVAISEGMQIGALPLDPSKLGLEQPATYATSYVKDVSYDSFGAVTVTLKDNSELGDAAGKKIVLVPKVVQNKVAWSLGDGTTAPRRYFPDL
jgi:hypothetical protein